jgi:hypothetical protein
MRAIAMTPSQGRYEVHISQPRIPFLDWRSHRECRHVLGQFQQERKVIDLRAKEAQ